MSTSRFFGVGFAHGGPVLDKAFSSGPNALLAIELLQQQGVNPGYEAIEVCPDHQNQWRHTCGGTGCPAERDHLLAASGIPSDSPDWFVIATRFNSKHGGDSDAWFEINPDRVTALSPGRTSRGELLLEYTDSAGNAWEIRRL